MQGLYLETRGLIQRTVNTLILESNVFPKGIKRLKQTMRKQNKLLRVITSNQKAEKRNCKSILNFHTLARIH